jgi:hypothetical protein
LPNFRITTPCHAKTSLKKFPLLLPNFRITTPCHAETSLKKL